jgi:hypothetical protein
MTFMTEPSFYTYYFILEKSFFNKHFDMLDCVPTTAKEINAVIQSLKTKTHIDVMKYLIK